MTGEDREIAEVRIIEGGYLRTEVVHLETPGAFYRVLDELHSIVMDLPGESFRAVEDVLGKAIGDLDTREDFDPGDDEED